MICDECGREFQENEDGDLLDDEQGCMFFECPMDLPQAGIVDELLRFEENEIREYEPDFFDNLEDE